MYGGYRSDEGGGYIEDYKREDNTKNAVNKGGNSWPSSTAKYITAVPIDLTQIKSISKYRSCAGHVRDGYNFDRVLENDRSMKHYFYPIPSYQGTLDKVRVFAPFDGTITELALHDGLPGKRYKSGNGITISTSIDPNVRFGFGHIYFAKDLKVGDKVKGGDLMGYAALGNNEYDFDIDLNAVGGTDAYNGREVLDSIFMHMTNPVLVEFAKYGVTPANTILKKEYRDASPCNYPNPGPKHQGRDNEDWVQLKH